jgi:predicted ArsR family transcriptional regulator
MFLDTKERILELLLGGKKSALTLSEELGIRESAVRAHLEALRSGGLVLSSLVRLGRGRPKKLYGLTEKGSERFPRRYDEVLELLVREIESDDAGRASRYMKGVAKRLARELLGERATTVGVKEAADLLNNLGFHTSYSETDGEATITSANCILRRLALKHPTQVCSGLHTWLIEELTGKGSVKLERCMAYGDEVCVHTVPFPNRVAN